MKPQSTIQRQQSTMVNRHVKPPALADRDKCNFKQQVATLSITVLRGLWHASNLSQQQIASDQIATVFSLRSVRFA